MRVHALLPILSFLVLAQAQSNALHTDDPEADAFIAWAAEASIPLELDRPIAQEVLAPLVEGKRFVFLGEPDHFIHQKYTFRLAFLRSLHALGWRHLGMEMGRADGIRLDRYLEQGNEADLLDVALYSGFSGVTTASGVGGFLGMELQYARSVRAIAEGPERIRYFGFDLDMRPGKGIEDARRRLGGIAAAEELGLVLDDAWSRKDELPALLEELRDPQSSLAASLPAERLHDLVLDLDCLSESLLFQRTASPFKPATTRGSGFTDDGLLAALDGFARREHTMFRLLDGYIATLEQHDRIVLTGHNMHPSRHWKGARWTELGSDVSVPLWPTIGAHLTDQFPEQVFAIWLVYDHGVHLNASDQKNTRVVSSVSGTVESLLARLPYDALLLPLASNDPRSAWLDEERTFRVNGGVGHGKLRELADALVFVREVEPPRPRD